MLVCKEYKAMGFSWRLLRDRYRAWFYLERDGQIIAESADRKQLLSLGWF